MQNPNPGIPIPSDFAHFNLTEEKRRRFELFKSQINSTVVVTVAGLAGCSVTWLLIASPFDAQFGPQFTALLTAVMIIGHIGGLVTRYDRLIHGIDEQLKWFGDWNEYSRTLFKSNIAHTILDIFGLLPMLMQFVCCMFVLWNYWTIFSAGLLILILCGLLAVAIAMIPISMSIGHSEAWNQIRLVRALRELEEDGGASEKFSAEQASRKLE